MKIYLTLALWVLGLSSILVGAFWYTTRPKPEIKRRGYAIGSIVGFKSAGKSAGGLAIVDYNVSGEWYQLTTGSSAYRANVWGEKYEVVYDIDNPSNGRVLTTKPRFLTTEDTMATKGRITRIYRYGFGGDSTASTHAVQVEYFVNNKKFKKSQDLPADFRGKYVNLQKQKSCDVVYWVHEPKRAIIYLEERGGKVPEPMSETGN